MSFVVFVLSMILAPLLLGVINRTKAVFAGRTGQPVLQTYYDLAKLLRKGAVYSRTTTWLFPAGPIIGLASLILVTALVPMGRVPAPFAFEGDILLFTYLLALLRFFYVTAALDTGSSFEGMGASREVQFAALAEPASFLALIALAHQTQSLSLTGIMDRITPTIWQQHFPSLFLTLGTLLVIYLTENCRVPIDDPNTHLELTMIHEVMVLDHSGPDLAMITYSVALKLWITGALIVGILCPVNHFPAGLGVGVFLIGMLLLGVLTGIIESIMARLRLNGIPKLLAGAGAMSALALVIVLR